MKEFWKKLMKMEKERWKINIGIRGKGKREDEMKRIEKRLEDEKEG